VSVYVVTEFYGAYRVRDLDEEKIMLNDFGDSKVTVKKSELLEALLANRTKHAADYAESYDGYCKEFVAEAERVLAQAMAGNFSKTGVSCTPPQDHTKDYDRVIRMMQMCTADEIIVTENQFSQYVLDEWNWMGAFNATKARYTSNTR
jgi:hypothetical protein